MRGAGDITLGIWLLTAFLIFKVGAAPLAAQVEYGSDVLWHSRYEWRGLTLRDGMVLQPDFYLSAGDRISLTIGGWTNIELTTPRPDEFGYENTFFGETNTWAELALASQIVDVAVGWNWYHFDVRRPTHVPIGSTNTHELYGRLQFPNLPVVVPRLAYFHDVDKINGGFIESSLTVRVPLWTRVKAPIGSILLTGSTGYNLSQDSIQAVERFQDRGFKYAEFSASTVIGYLPISLFDAIFAHIAWDVGFHLQFNLDSTTKNTVLGMQQLRETWWTIGIQWFGPRCEPTKRIC